jgi:hypothetical protein
MVQICDYDYYQMDTWEKMQELLPHFLSAIENAVSPETNNVQCGWLYNEVALFFYCQG